MKVTKKAFLKKFDTYLLKHRDLIDAYEEKFFDDVLDLANDIFFLFEKINRTNRIGLSQLLDLAFSRAIVENKDVLTILNDIKLQGNEILGENTSIQSYFKEVNRIYKENNNNYNIEYCPENRDSLIQMNLKSVIAVAKGYQNLGVPLEDLIAAGNEGLVVSFDKYDPARATLKESIINKLQESQLEEFSTADLNRLLDEFFKYGDIKKQIFDAFDPATKHSKEEIICWAKKNIENAKFNSVANMWINAFIISEINDNSRLVKKPKAEIQKDRVKDGFYRKESIVELDAPVAKDSDTPMSDIFSLEDDDKTDLDVVEARKGFKHNLDLLLEGVKGRDRGILLKKFGIGLPRPMEPKEIADQEGLSIARVSQIFQSVITQMQENRIKHNIDESTMYELLEKMIC